MILIKHRTSKCNKTRRMKEHGETEGIYEAAEKGVVEAIITGQTPEVDAVSGATNTSNGIMEAVKAALADAK